MFIHVQVLQDRAAHSMRHPKGYWYEMHTHTLLTQTTSRQMQIEPNHYKQIHRVGKLKCESGLGPGPFIDLSAIK